MGVGSILALLTALLKAVGALLGLRDKVAQEQRSAREQAARTRFNENERAIADATKAP